MEGPGIVFVVLVVDGSWWNRRVVVDPHLAAAAAPIERWVWLEIYWGIVASDCLLSCFTVTVGSLVPTGDVPPASDIGRRQAARGGETARRPWTVDGGRSPLTLYIN